MKEGEYAKTVANVLASVVFHLRDIQRNYLPAL